VKKIKIKYLAIVIVFFIVLLDQILKFYIKLNFKLGEQYIIFDWFRIYFLENSGIAWGLKLSEENWGKYLQVILRLISIPIIYYYLLKYIKNNLKIPVISLSLILGGAIGNLIDGLFYGMIFSSSEGQIATLFPKEGGYSSFMLGNVVDMFFFPLFTIKIPSFIPLIGNSEFLFFQYVFNIADSAITIGFILLLLFYKKF